MQNQDSIDPREIFTLPVETCREALELERHRIICLVGAGGKTSLMFAMARELADFGNHVITSTTTKIFKPSREETPFILLRKGAGNILKAIPDMVHQYGHFTLVERRLPGKKLKGVSPEIIDGLGALDEVEHIIVEADGAARLPLKAPDENEPVITSKTSLVVVVVGIDGIGVDLTKDYVFRPHIVSELTGLPMGEKVTIEAIAKLMIHPRGMAKGTPPHATIIPFLNKVDIPDGFKKGRALAGLILEKGHPRINRVVLGHAIREKPVVAVLSRKEDA
ncbi:MAG: putative selenium-dependent hydroxylase accessory protein YqeC [Syntrophobacterales bacterium]|nr:MAG: putative selenium-dependent hydroxylase accessory protein YqeC [Syntrophobacterales bacterium]